MLRGNQSQVAHQRWGTFEPAEVSSLTDQLHRGHQSNSPESSQNLHRFAKPGQCGGGSDLPLYLPDPRLDEISLRQMAAQNMLIIGLTQPHLVDPNHELLRPVTSRIIDLHARTQKMHHTHFGPVKTLNQSRATARQTPRGFKLPIGNETLRLQSTVHPQFLQILVQYIATGRRLVESTKFTVRPVTD